MFDRLIITQKHMDNADPHDTGKWAIALALRAQGCKKINIDYNGMKFAFPDSPVDYYTCSVHIGGWQKHQNRGGQGDGPEQTLVFDHDRKHISFDYEDQVR